jgi:arginyl-tRNA synthetase
MDQFRRVIAEAVARAFEAVPEDIEPLLALPPRPDMGDLALPCFQFAKARRSAPTKIAAELAAALVADPARPAALERIEATGPYVNFTIDAQAMLREAFACAEGIDEEQPLAHAIDPADAEPPVLTIDYSSPNIAKEFSVAHLRSTALGRSLVMIHRALGWRVVGINHLGDWGTQFGLLINAYRANGDPAALEREPIRHLQSLYVAISQRAKTDPAVQDEARATFRRLEEGDPEIVALWRLFRDLSLAEFQRIYNLLNVRFEAYEGESFYNDKLEAVIESFVKAGIAREDDGALIVPMPGNEAPLLLRKSDGASTYGTRDLAALAWRAECYRFSRNLYCVDARQSQHFRQVFLAHAQLGEAQARQAALCRHVPFGTVTVDGSAMSTREGNVILLEAYIGELAARAAEIVRDKNPDLPADTVNELSMQVAIGALTYEMLKREQSHNVDFRREESLKFEGETGPRLMYLHAARLSSLLRTYPQRLGVQAPSSIRLAASHTNLSLLSSPHEKNLARLVLMYPGLLRRAADECAPNHLCNYLQEVTDAFNNYYHAVTIIDPADAAGSAARIGLVRLLKGVVGHALGMLGIPAPERM